jgi:3-oxoacyl-[acyl-carrier protein] reductase
MIIINGINSEIIKKILPKFLKKYKVVGVYNSKYNGVKHKNLFILKKNKKYLDKINHLVKNEKKIIFLNFAAKRDQGLVLKFDQKKFLDTIQNNIVDSLKILKILLPHMIRNNFGRIIFSSSSTAENGSIGNLGYSSSKSSLKGISGTIAKEYKDYNITSNILSLGFFNSRMWKTLPEKNKKTLISNTLNSKLCDENAIYEIIETLIKFNSINMSTIFIDGGNLQK